MELETFLPYRLAVVAEAFSRQLNAVYGRKYGFSREEWRMLFLLADAGSLDSLQLAQRTSLDKVQVSRAAARLERKGMIVREILGTDKRLRNYVVTAKGKEIFQSAFAEVQARTEEIMKAMSADERSALDRGITGLDQAIGKVATAGSSGKGEIIPHPAGSAARV